MLCTYCFWLAGDQVTVSFKIMQNQLFVRFVLSTCSTSPAASMASRLLVLSKSFARNVSLTRSLPRPTRAQCSVITNGYLTKVSRLQLTPAFGQLLNHVNQTCQNCSPVPLIPENFQNTWQFQSLRGLSTSAPVQGIFSKSAEKKLTEDNLIYTGPLSNIVKMVKLFSLSTSGISLLILQALFISGESGSMKLLGGSMASLLFLTPILLHWVSKSYATQIYYDQATDTYTANTVGVFLATIRHDFTTADVEIPAVRNLMTSILVKGRPLLIDPRAFISPNHYSHLMGYDKLPDDMSAEELKKVLAEFSEEERKD
ncbi:transmembrane protein 70 homolog, mitochondrial-like [Acanthaster planci]|uniref:Transmembrane protein 70 homolog, mitochondrial-like n=1 Tax=Acanthaster planci TaxID=133434 RepID=A0A8B7YHB2_ACAPL|nr:transmembrane protein 70 homolog, mitochondrial-like [Acanthaster planci]